MNGIHFISSQAKYLLRDNVLDRIGGIHSFSVKDKGAHHEIYQNISTKQKL
jgi:hypothetical protein